MFFIVTCDVTQAEQRAGNPQHVHHQSGQHQGTTHDFTVLYLERVQHGDVPLLPHGLCKEKTTLKWKKDIFEFFHNDNL